MLPADSDLAAQRAGGVTKKEEVKKKKKKKKKSRGVKLIALFKQRSTVSMPRRANQWRAIEDGLILTQSVCVT